MTSPIIQCHQLSHIYSGKAALSNLTFELKAGEPIGLVGPNGAGKTTLLNILSGLLKPTTGKVTLFGHPAGATALIGQVSALPQDARLDPSFSVLEQLIFYARLQGMNKNAATLEANRVLEAVALKAIATEKPVALSHGMAKRVAIAQALMGQPALTLLDEPTAGLDPLNVRTIRQLIVEQAAATTFIISSHDLTELDRLCPQVLLLDKGEMQIARNSTEEMQANTRHITLQMEACPTATVMAKLQTLIGVLQVTNSQQNEFIVTYDPQVQANMDIHIMQCIQENHWRYRQLNHGKTLEEKLFF